MSGSIPIRVNVILVAVFEGACPHLRSDLLCGNYEARPRVCRIYPAEVRPGVQLQPDAKLCPPKAWHEDQPVYMSNGALTDTNLETIIEDHRIATLSDVVLKARTCVALAIADAALANEGYAVYEPGPARLAQALDAARSQAGFDDRAGQWNIVTNRHATLTMLEDVEARSLRAAAGDSYIGFFEET